MIKIHERHERGGLVLNDDAAMLLLKSHQSQIKNHNGESGWGPLAPRGDRVTSCDKEKLVK